MTATSGSIWARSRSGRAIGEFLPPAPLVRLHGRHTVGLLDPITAADVGEPPDDGLPVTLEGYLDRDRVSKIKVAPRASTSLLN